MIFNALTEAAERNELILIDGSLCHYHLCKDNQLAIREIIVLPEYQRQGIDAAILERFKQSGATSIFAKRPSDLPANGGYQQCGFVNEGIETTRTGKQLRLWRLQN